MYQYSYTSLMLLLILGLFVLIPFNAALAQVSFETNEATFDANNPGLSVQDFQAAGVASGTIRTCTASPINSSTNDNCFSPGDILPGLDFVDNPGPDSGGLLVLGDSTNGSANPANVLTNNTIANALDVEFTGTTTAVGLTIGCVSTAGACSETIVLSVFGATDNFLSSTNVAVTDAVDSFIGIRSVEAISRISMDFLAPDGNTVKAIHEIKFGEVPTVRIVDVNQGACVLTKSNLNAFKIEGATPDKKVAVVMGLKYGQLIVNGPVCNGLELGVRQAQIFALAKADGDGNVMLQAPVPPIGDEVSLGFFQVVDIDTCTASQVSMLDILIDEIETADDDGDGVPNCFDACPDEGPPGPGQGLGEDGCITDEVIIE